MKRTARVRVKRQNGRTEDSIDKKKTEIKMEKMKRDGEGWWRRNGEPERVSKIKKRIGIERDRKIWV
jgi:hypothetical protein